jgi:hypothetical protein
LLYNTLAYWAHLSITKKMKCCKYALSFFSAELVTKKKVL